MQMIEIRRASQNNLKGIDVSIPKGVMTVLTGISGSGKSSLAFDTIYAEGYRRYMDSLSIQARTFMEQLPRAKVGSIEGLAPAIAISQRISRPSPRATVASVTEIHAYLRLLFAHEGIPICPICNKELSAYTRKGITDFVLALPERSRVILMAPLVRERMGCHEEILRTYSREGFVRVRIDGEYMESSEAGSLNPSVEHTIDGVIDRIVVRDGIRERLADSVETALRLGSGVVLLEIRNDKNSPPRFEYLGTRASCPQCKYVFPDITPGLFSQNSVKGMCPSCDGMGRVGHLERSEVITSPSKGLLEGAIGPLNGKNGLPEPMYIASLKSFCSMMNISPRAPLSNYSDEALDVLLYGVPSDGALSSKFEGIIPFLKNSDSNGETEVCPHCSGTGLRSESLHVKVNGHSISEFTKLEIGKALEEISQIRLKISSMHPIMAEILGRLEYLEEVGLSYLTLDRKANTLSGGELQRIRLATQIGSNLSGVIYVLDEPTIGLHPQDTRSLLAALDRFLTNNNTVIVVEHNREVIEKASHVIEIGPGAGGNGGELVFSGTLRSIMEQNETITSKYLTGSKWIARPNGARVTTQGFLEVKNAHLHNLKGINVLIPIGHITCLAGASGAGKSTLAVDTIFYEFDNAVTKGSEKNRYARISGWERLNFVSLVDPSPLKRSHRSNLTTYLGFAQEIRKVFAATPEAKMKGYNHSRFSTNVKGGRCESCQGSGLKKLEMVFLPDVFVPCEDCTGTGFHSEVLEIRFKGLNYADVLEMDVDEAERFFIRVPKIRKPLGLLREIGLGYLKLGQSATTFSGGEAQRIKLAAGLLKHTRARGLFVLDEPTIGLHFDDINRLLVVLNKLAEKGHTVVVVEHDPEFIACCDHIIELGEGGGDAGGYLVAEGTPSDIAKKPTKTGIELAKLKHIRR